MKKKLFLVLTLIIGLVLTANVSAKTESELLAELSKEYTINGVTAKLDAGYIKDIQDYLDVVELSSADCDYISKQLEKAIEVVKASKATKWSEISASNFEKLSAIVADVTENTPVEATLSKDGNLTLLKNGEVVTVISKNKIQYTGSNELMMIIVGTISLVGLALITRKVVRG